MSEVYAQSLLIQPGKVLGRQLKPFSLYHAMVLRTMDSPYCPYNERDDCNALELIAAVYVCSISFHVDRSDLAGSVMTDTCGKWGRKHRKILKNKELMQAEHEKLLNHIAAYTDFPGRFAEKSAKEPEWRRLEMSLAISLMSNGIATEERAWNMGLGLALCYAACASIANGDEGVMTEDEEHGLEILTQQEQEEGAA